MSDYGTMQSRIADELIRSDLTTQIARAIQSAIRHYSRERFYFNEAQWTSPTVASQRMYAVPSDLVDVDMIKIRVQGFDYELLRRDWNYLENVDTSPTYTGQPTDWAYFANQFRLYPVPDAVYTLTLSGLSTLEALSESDDTNAWMVEGEELIRARAKWDLCTSVLMDPASASLMKAIELDALGSLKGRSNVRLSMGRVRPDNF
jgi:hypothetical protein